MSNLTPREMKEGLIEEFRKWLEDPGNTNRLIFEASVGLNAQRQPVRLFTMKGEATFQQCVVPLPAPLIAVAGGLPQGMPPMPGKPG